MIETFINLSWRLYVALPLMVAGTTFAIWSARLGRPALLCAVRGDPSHLIALMQRFRGTIIGLAIVGIGAAWIWHLTWLFIVSLTIAAGETFETSLIIFALRHGSRLQLGTPRVRG